MDYGVKAKEISIYCDKTSVIAPTKNPFLHSMSKHIDIRHHFIRDHGEKKNIKLEYINTEK